MRLACTTMYDHTEPAASSIRRVAFLVIGRMTIASLSARPHHKYSPVIVL